MASDQPRNGPRSSCGMPSMSPISATGIAAAKSLDEIDLSLDRRFFQQPIDELFDAGLQNLQGARRECRSQKLADPGVIGRIVEHQACCVVLVEEAIGEVGPEIEFLVRTPNCGVTIDRQTIVVARQKIRSVRHPMHRIELAERAVGRVGVVKEGSGQLLQVESGDRSRRRRNFAPAVRTRARNFGRPPHGGCALIAVDRRGHCLTSEHAGLGGPKA